MSGEIPSTPQPEDDSPDIEGRSSDSAVEQPLDEYFFVDFYDDHQHDRPISKERRMLAAAHFLKEVEMTGPEEEMTPADEEAWRREFDTGPQLAMWVVTDRDPDVQKQVFDAIAQAIDRGEVQGRTVAMIVAELAELNRSHFDAYKKLKDKTADQW